MSQEVVRVQKATHHWTYVQCALTKFQASACPATFLAMELMVGPTSIRRIFSGSKVYSRYLRDKEGASLCKKIVAGIHLIRGASTQTRVVVHAVSGGKTTRDCAFHLLSSQIFLVQARAWPSWSLSAVSVEL